MSINSFDMSEVYLMIDIMRDDRKRWIESGPHVTDDVLGAYDSIIKKLSDRIEDHNGMNRAIRTLEQTIEKVNP